MKKKIAKTARTSTPAEITITVTKFRDVLAPGATRKGQGTDYVMSMKKSHPGVVLEGDDIQVKWPGAGLCFTIASPAGDGAKYFPTGITFLREGVRSTSDEQRLGLLNFPQDQTRLDGRSLSITDSYADEAKKVRYKFSILIQCGADGKIGLIDPGIVHEDEH